MSIAMHSAAHGPNHVDMNVRRPTIVGAVGVVALIGILGVWAWSTSISGAVISHGQVNVIGNAKTVQSLDGGIVNDIFVQNGDHVLEGQILARLDPTLLHLNLDIARGRLAAAVALRARLDAERILANDVIFDYANLPSAVLQPALDTAAEEQGQRAIFIARAEMIQGDRDQLAGRLRDIDNQVAGITGQITALRDQLTLVEDELQNARKLVDQGLARQSELSDRQLTQAALRGDLAAAESELARLSNSRREAELETLQRERDFRQGVLGELREVTATIEELVLEIATRSAQLARVEIRAPSDGIVHEMQITTLGGVVAPGGTLLDIIPQASGLEFELRIEATAIDQIYEGQPVDILLSSFDRQTTPKLAGTVASISPGAVSDPRTGQVFYRVGLDVPEAELRQVDHLAIKPGMPVEAYLHTGDRTVLSYLMQPLSSHMRRAMRE